MSLPRLAVAHRAAVVLATVLLSLAGLYALGSLPAGIYPEATFPRIAVVARGGTFEPRDMVVAVTRPLEEAVSGVIDLRRIRSRTVRGGGRAQPRFPARRRHALRAAAGAGPDRAAATRHCRPGSDSWRSDSRPRSSRCCSSSSPARDPVLLRDLAQYTIRPRLARLPDVGSGRGAGRTGPGGLGRARSGPARESPRERRPRWPSGSARPTWSMAAGSGRSGVPAVQRRWSPGSRRTPERSADSWWPGGGRSPGPGRRPRHGALRRRGPLPARRRQRRARRAHQRVAPAAREHPARWSGGGGAIGRFLRRSSRPGSPRSRSTTRARWSATRSPASATRC